MRRFISLTALLLSISLFLSHGTSYSNAKVRGDATLSIVPEERALIAITYGEDNNLSVTNNTAKTIKVSNVEMVNEDDHPIISLLENGTATIHPGDSRQFNVPNDTDVLLGKAIQLLTRWNGGNAQINSTIPELFLNSLVEEEEEVKLENSEDDAKLKSVEERGAEPELTKDDVEKKDIDKDVTPVNKEENKAEIESDSKEKESEDKGKDKEKDEISNVEESSLEGDE